MILKTKSHINKELKNTKLTYSDQQVPKSVWHFSGFFHLTAAKMV